MNGLLWIILAVNHNTCVVRWHSVRTTATGQGLPMQREAALASLVYLEREYGRDIRHWLECGGNR